MIYNLSSMSYFIPFITGKGPRLWFTVIFIIEMDIWIHKSETNRGLLQGFQLFSEDV